MAYMLSANEIGYQQITAVETTQKHPIGAIVTGVDGTLGMGEFVYLKGSASIVAGSLVYYSDNVSADTAKLTTTSGVVDGGSPIAIAVSAVDAVTKYGWFQITGKATVLKTATKIDPASSFKVYLSATAGRVMPTSVAGRQVLGARFQNAATVTTTTSTCIVTLNRASQKTGDLL